MTSPESAWLGHLRPPNKSDGLAIHRLIAQCPPLDTNSSYCNFVQIEHFRETCVVAEKNGNIVGFLSGHIIPTRPDTLFVWQVAIAESVRGEGLALSLLRHLLSRESLHSIQYLETSITKSNKSSWALFNKLDRLHQDAGQVSIFLDHRTHFDGTKETEHLFRIPILPLMNN